MKVIIVEDEPLAQDFLSKLLTSKYSDIEIIKTLESVKDSISYFSKAENEVDLIFMDIHLKDGNCFKIFEKTKINTPIIFTTAFDEYAIKAFDVNSISYILKPLSESKIKKAMDKFYQTKHQDNDADKIEKLISIFKPEQNYKKRITVKLGDKIIVIEEKDIAYFIAEGRTCYLYTKDNNKYIVDSCLEILNTQLNPKNFFRISRDCITSFNSIKNISKHFKGRLTISLIPQFEKNFIISQERVSDFMKFINGE
ncbi:MAG: Response regulator of the LytR/AlgR family [Bacteroidetes bacterium]|nr:Response regulator of the LytR/AlgR family [Bacteroidota bacterium]